MSERLHLLIWLAAAALVAVVLLLARKRRLHASRSASERALADSAAQLRSESTAAPALIARTDRPAHELKIILRRPSATRHPILLAHGWFGFDRIGLAQLGQDYFRGVPQRLRALGYAVHVARVSPTASIVQRAAQLACQVEQLGHRVNIIAHSMGGLDARLAINRHGLGERVASLTTIGTPHHGTPLADMALVFGEWRTLRRCLDSVGVNVDGLYNVSTARMREFNRAVLDSPEVVYTSVVGAVNLDTAGVNAMLYPAHSYLLGKAGPNDGVVPASSQVWGEPLDEVDADHWAQIGWFGRFDVQGFYAQLAERLSERGL